MSRLLTLIALGICYFNSPLATAQSSFTGNSLLTKCLEATKILNSPSDRPSGANVAEAYQCSAFVTGIRVGLVVGSTWERNRMALPCVPNNVPDSQLIRVVLAWLNSNPQELHQPAGVLVAVALRDAFSCK